MTYRCELLTDEHGIVGAEKSNLFLLSMVDLNSLKRNLERLESNSNFRLQSQGVSMLMSQVQEFVRQIGEEEAAVQQIYELERIVHSKPKTPEEEREVAEAQRALRIAEELKRNISAKKMVLRQLGNEVHSLYAEIQKII